MIMAMKLKSIEDLLERVKTWPEIAQADLAQAALGIEAELERGGYGESYTPTREEAAVLEQRIRELDEGTVKPVSYEDVRALFAKYRRP
jgi:hypothetical protein